MNKEELFDLKHGLYRVWWRSGGSSFACVGGHSNGARWIAICNWVNGSIPMDEFINNDWCEVKRMTLIQYAY